MCFVNMNCETMLKKELEAKNIFKGNPILDILYEAKQKFGPYKTYTVGCENPRTRLLNLHHCLIDASTKSKVESYLKELRLTDHMNFYSEYTKSEALSR